MGKDRKPTIAIMAGNAESEYIERLMAGFRNCAQEEDVNLVFLLGPHIPRHCKDVLAGSFAWDFDYQFHTLYEQVRYMKPDAIIVQYGSLSHFKHVPDVDEFVARFKGIPTLVLGDSVEDPEVPHLIGGNYSGMKECVRHLVEDHGYRRIGFVGGPKRNYDSNHRMQAYKDVLTEHGIEVNEDMIVYGNYTEYIEPEVEYLLDNYPDIEAIVFANDNMAKGGYRVCASRDLIVGKDIAITGFDDGDIAKSLEPTLSSVAHSSYLFSYRAMKLALEMIRGNKPESAEMQAYFNRRESCGCHFALNEKKKIASLTELKAYMMVRAGMITDELFSTLPYERDKQDYCLCLEAFLQEVIRVLFIEECEEVYTETMRKSLKKLCRHPFVSKRFLLEYVERTMFELMDFASPEQRMNITSLLRSIKQYIHSQEINTLQQDNRSKDRKMWFIPSFTADLINARLDMREQMSYLMGRMQAMDIKSAYLFFSMKEIQVQADEPFQPADTLYLTAYFNEHEMVSYRPQEMVPVKYNGDGLYDILPQDKARAYSAFVLFSGEAQYGLLLCEGEHKEFPFMLISSMQLGTLRRIIDMNIRERKMQHELEEKNRILSVISMYDEMTKVYNRRGFVENALKLIGENKGKKAYLVFADLDHLKEINDSFGHAAGDFAIKAATEYLQNCTPEGTIVGRIGGDEYVALFVPEAEYACLQVIWNVKQYAHTFNEKSGQPFYVELSVGVYEFVCSEDTDLGELFKESDAVLYEQKRTRRTSVKR